MNKVRSIFITILLVIISFAVVAEPLYKRDITAGVPFYTNKHEGEEDLKPVDIPDINRAEVKFMATAKNTCNGHQGIDCAKGSDIDGSVICTDDFKDSEERFVFMCKYANLQIIDDQQSPDKDRLIIYVRNIKPISAMNPVVSYKSDLGYNAKLVGPSEILPYSIGEFELKSEDAIIIGKRLDKTRFLLTCDNCGGDQKPATEEKVKK